MFKRFHCFRCLHRFSAAALVAASVGWSLGAVAAESIVVIDDRGRQIALDAPAKRIVTLAPHIAENFFAIGAGDRLAGAVSFSDYPEAARKVPKVGSYSKLDLEKIVAMQPDLIMAWTTGGNLLQAERLEALGLTVFYSESRTFEDVADTLERMGRLTGTESSASQVAEAFRSRVRELRAQYSDASSVSVFYQVWEQPLMTVSDEHLIAQAIALCGGNNIFGGMDTLIPRISRENVLAANPEIIVAGGMGEERRDWLTAWERWPALQAVANDRLVFIPPSLIQRHTPRVLQGTAMLCEAIDATRSVRRTE